MLKSLIKTYPCLVWVLTLLFLFLTSAWQPAWVVEGHRPEADWPRDGDIRLQGYSTRYRPGLQLVLNKVTAHICSGEKVSLLTLEKSQLGRSAIYPNNNPNDKEQREDGH